MNWLKNLKFFAALVFVCGMLLSVTVTSCDTKTSGDNDAETEQAEEGENNEHPKEDAEHPQSEHPENDSDSTKVEESNQ